MPKVGLRKDDKNRRLLEGEYQKPNGSYEYRYKDKEGKLHSIYSLDLQELRRRKEEIKSKNFLKDNRNLTMNDFYKRWKDIKEGTIKDNVFRNYCYNYVTYVADKIGRMKVGEIKQSDVKKFYKSLYDTRKLKVASIDSVHTVIHQVLQLAYEDDYIAKNPSDKCLEFLKKSHGHEKDKIRALTVSEQEIFENSLYNDPKNRIWMPFFITMLYTGMRIGEVSGLQYEDIDFDNDLITMKHTLVYYDKRQKGHRCEYGMNSPKTEAGYRKIPLLPKVKEALLENKETMQDLNRSCQRSIDGYSDFVFINRNNNPFNQSDINRAIRRIVKDINDELLSNEKDNFLPMFSSHTLRHTFITRSIEKGIPLPVVMDVVGHKDIETTLQIYNDVQDEFKSREMMKLNDYFENF